LWIFLDGKSEQRSVIKFFFRKGLGSKPIHRELTAVLAYITYLLTEIKELRAHFELSNLSCEDQYRHGRPLHVFGKILSDLLEEFPFATARIIAQHFFQSKHVIKEILQRELGYRDSTEGGHHIYSRKLKRPIEQRWQLTC
jgi:hypothetical protein